MIELTTLKDLNCVHCNDKCDKFDCTAYTMHTSHAVYSEDLRQEAIKWVKELRCGSSLSWKENHPFYEFRHDTYPIAEFIKNRFNITDEDLK